MSELETEFRTELEAVVAAFGIERLTDEQSGQLVQHYSLLRRWNQRVNLTRIIEPHAAAKLHFAESLFGAKFLAGARNVLDVGSGAGFPAIPLAVVCAETHFTALEANQKKALFLKEVKDALELDNFDVANVRLENFDLTGHDFLTSRALDRAESILPLIIKRMSSDQELMLYCARNLIEKLAGSRPCATETHSIPLSEQRVIALIRAE